MNFADRNREIWELRKAGASLEVIGRKFYISRQCVFQILQRMPPLPKPKPRPKIRKPVSPEQQKEIVKLYAENVPSTEIGKIFGFSHHVVLRVLRELGLVKRRYDSIKALNAKRKKYDYEEVMRLYRESDMDVKDIAKMFGGTLRGLFTTIDRLRKAGKLKFNRQIYFNREN